MKFWIWLRKLANEKIKAEHLHSRKCERCKLWTSEVGGAKAVRYDLEDGYSEYMTCNWCGHESRWDCRGMLPVLVPDSQFTEARIGE